MNTLVTTDFGFAAFVAIQDGSIIERISAKDGISIKFKDSKYLQELKEDYKKSKFKTYNSTLREIIAKFKESAK